MAEVEAEKREEILCAFSCPLCLPTWTQLPLRGHRSFGTGACALAEEAAHLMAEQIYAKRHEFVFAGLALSPEEAITGAGFGDPVIVSDSGDNPTGGGPGLTPTS